MKRTEFVDLVNEIAQEERVQIADAVTKIAANSQQPFTDMLAELALQIADTSARTTAKIIEQSGLVTFDEQFFLLQLSRAFLHRSLPGHGRHAVLAAPVQERQFLLAHP